MSAKYYSILICLALTLTTIAVFYQVYGFGFVSYDDNEYLYENPNIQQGITIQSVKWALTTNHTGYWHPLTWLSYILDWQLYGSNPAGYHLTNLFFHIVNTLLLFVVLNQMTKAFWRSAFVAALFALHPLHVESVAWVSERKDVLSTFFWMMTMWAYVRFVSRPKKVNYLLVVLFFALGLMSKPMLVTLPFVLLLLDYWPLGRIRLEQKKKHAKGEVPWRVLYHLILEKIPFFVLFAASSVITFVGQQVVEAMVPFTVLPLKYRILNSFISYVEYIKKMFWPSRLAIFYPHPEQNVSTVYALISAGLLLAATILVLRYAKNHQYLATGWLWYLGTLLPVIGLVQVGSQSMADRYTYTTLTGLFIIIAWGVPDLFAKLRHKQIVLTASGLLIISALSVCTWFQLRHWRNNETLFRHALEVTENNYIAHLHLAEFLFEQSRFDEAEEHYKKFIRIRPDDPKVVNTLGAAVLKQGRVNEAVEYFTRALRINPGYASAHANLGYALLLQGDLNGALAHLVEAAQLNPQLVAAHFHLGHVLARMGQTKEAVPQLEEALRLKSDSTQCMNDLAWLLATSNQAEVRDPNRAIALAERACELTSYNKPDLLHTLAVAYAARGDFGKAVETIEKALALCQSPQQQSLKKELENRLILFRAGKPYVESKQSSGPLPKRNNN